MPIGWITMLGVYIICWWTVLFAVLPLGTSQERHEPPTDGAQWGAPDKPDLKRKFITTTWVSTLLGTGEPRIGAHGTPILFLHPKDMGGVLVELMETPKPHSESGAH